MTDQPWWKSGVLYQVYPRSFADSDRDGVGDLRGVIAHLDHLEWLGVDGLWLSPITVSPDADWGYDVADFCAVQPVFGTLDDLDRLIEDAGHRGIRVLMDLVPNHTSAQHPWFLEARASRTAPRRDWYVWADAGPDGAPPNNWVSSFGGPAWTPDPLTGQSYLHNHLSEQPDLNWWNEEVREAFDDIITFWCRRGVAGFRIDVCNVIVKDALLRDNPVATADDDFEAQLFGQRAEFNANRPEVHEVIRRWRVLADSFDDPCVLLGETPVPVERLGAYYGNGQDELDLAFNFPFISAPFEADALRDVVEATETSLPAGAWPVWTGSNHDMFRFPSRWAGGDERKARLALMMLLTLRGTVVLYQGDEIGMPDTELVQDDLRDPLGVRYWPHYAGRDAGRTPVHWHGGPGGGFTAPGVRPWLPLGDVAGCNVASQKEDAASMLTLTRDLIALRRRDADLRSGDYRSVPGPPGTWVFERGGAFVVALNMSDAGVTVPGPSGAVCIGTDRQREGEAVAGAVHLDPWEGVMVARTATGP